MLGFFNRLGQSIGSHFTRAIKTFSSFLVSSQRIGKFLLQDELDSSKKYIHGDDQENIAVQMRNFTAFWSNEKAFGLKNIDLTIKKSKRNIRFIIAILFIKKLKLLS